MVSICAGIRFVLVTHYPKTNPKSKENPQNTTTTAKIGIPETKN